MKQPLVWAVSLFLTSIPDWAQSAAAESGHRGGTPHGSSERPSSPASVASSTGVVFDVGRLIFKAIESHDIRKIRKCIEIDPDILDEVGGRDKKTPLHHAVNKQSLGSVKYLLSLGADPNVPGPRGRTAIFSAVRKYRKAQGTDKEQKAESILDLLLFYPKTDLKKKSDSGRSIEKEMPKNKKNDYRRALALQGVKAEEKESESASSASSSAASPSETVSASLAAASAAAEGRASSSAASVSSVEAQPAM